MTTTEKNNRELIRRYTEEVFVNRNYAVIDEVMAEEIDYFNPALPGEISSPDEFKGAVQMIHSAFPDLGASVEDIVAEGSKVATRTREWGTHKGAFGDVPPTGNSFDVQAINIYRIERGKINGVWVQFDSLSMMQQLGLAPSAEEAGT